MKKHLFFIAVLFVATLAGCQDKGEEVKTADGETLEGPAQYNDYLVSQQNQIIAKFKNLNQAYDQYDSTAIERAHARLDQQIEKTIADVKKLPAYGQDTTLKNAALQMFIYYQRLTDNELNRIGNIVSQGEGNITESDVDEVDSLYNNFRKEIKSYEINFGDAQKEFAEEHGMKIKPRNKVGEGKEKK